MLHPISPVFTKETAGCLADCGCQASKVLSTLPATSYRTTGTAPGITKDEGGRPSEPLG